MPPEAAGPGGSHREGTKMRMPPRGHTRIHWQNSHQTGTPKLTVPRALARLVGPDRLFKVELTPEGILYRYVEGGEPVPQLPGWLTDV